MICNNRNKGSVTRQQDFGRTPLSDIFRGELRSRLQREGEHSTDDIQPFFTLQLNIEVSSKVTFSRRNKSIYLFPLLLFIFIESRIGKGGTRNTGRSRSARGCYRQQNQARGCSLAANDVGEVANNLDFALEMVRLPLRWLHEDTEESRIPS